MKNKQVIKSFIATILITIIILVTGYNILAKAGKYYLNLDGKITKLSTDLGVDYVFYSQSDDDLKLYPWNYYDLAVKFCETPEMLNSENLFDLNGIYKQVTYYFYRTLPQNICQYIYDKDSIPLSTRICFDSFLNDIYVSVVNGEAFYFYQKEIAIDSVHYQLTFSFNSASKINSFQIENIKNKSNVSSSDLDNGKSFLSTYIDIKDKNYLSLISYDILTNKNLFENYSLEKSYYNYEYTNELQSSEKSEINDNFTDSSIIINKDNNAGLSGIEEEKIYDKTSYQIVETKDEILIILLESNTVLHFDPISKMITGFNLSGL